jgi:hypothetical protein
MSQSIIFYKQRWNLVAHRQVFERILTARDSSDNSISPTNDDPDCSNGAGKRGCFSKLYSPSACVFLIFISCFDANELQAATENILNPDHDPYINVDVGFSPFLGALGAEYQRGNHAVGLGFPNRLSYRYFEKPFQNTRFWGMYLGGMNYTNEEHTVDGFQYQNLETRYIGAGAGYRWQWLSGWHTNVSLAIHYRDWEHTNPGTSMRARERGYSAFPGMNIGYKF